MAFQITSDNKIVILRRLVFRAPRVVLDMVHATGPAEDKMDSTFWSVRKRFFCNYHTKLMDNDCINHMLKGLFQFPLRVALILCSLMIHQQQNQKLDNVQTQLVFGEHQHRQFCTRSTVYPLHCHQQSCHQICQPENSKNGHSRKRINISNPYLFLHLMILETKKSRKKCVLMIP